MRGQRPRLAAVAEQPHAGPLRAVKLRRFSLRAALLGGAAAGFAAGLFAGCLLGAVLSWLAGQALDWQSHLAFQLGVTEELLPLGQQIGLLVFGERGIPWKKSKDQPVTGFQRLVIVGTMLASLALTAGDV